MKYARILVAGTALAASAAFAVVDSSSPTQSEELSSGMQTPPERQSNDNPWFGQGEQNPWSAMAERDAAEPLAEPSSPLSELGALPSESSAMAPMPSEAESPHPTLPDTTSETYAPPMGLGTDTYRS